MGTERAGGTLGVEEEYHLVDPRSFRLTSRPELARQVTAERGKLLQSEMLTSQLEATTGVCSDLAQLRGELLRARASASSVAAAHGAVILATSTHPFALLDEIDVLDKPRFRQLGERFGAVVRQLNLVGCHVHVSVPDLDTAVAIMNHARPYLPVLAALTGSSPFHEGRDTGFDSFRLAQLALWPQGGLPPHLESAAHYRAVLAELTDIGLIAEPSMLLWELRPSDRYPTLEFRIADMCPDLDDVVLHAGLVRSLVRVLAERVAAGRRPPAVDDAILRAARWRAARYGLTDRLWSPARRALAPAAAVVRELWAELKGDLADHGEARELDVLLRALMSRGTSSARQRNDLAATSDLVAVTRAAVELTLREVSAGAAAAARTAPVSPHP